MVKRAVMIGRHRGRDSGGLKKSAARAGLEIECGVQRTNPAIPVEPAYEP